MREGGRPVEAWDGIRPQAEEGDERVVEDDDMASCIPEEDPWVLGSGLTARVFGERGGADN